MRTYLLLAALLPACSFDIEPVVYPPGALSDGSEGVIDLANPPGADFAVEDAPPSTSEAGPLPDLTMPRDVETFPDLSQPGPNATLVIDGRSPSAWPALAQPWLRDYPGTIAHYRFDEMGAGALIDASGKGNNLDPAGGMFTGNRGAFTHIPAAGGGGLTRVATEFTTRGFVAANNATLEQVAQDFTVEVWFKLAPEYPPLTKSCDPILHKGPAPGYTLCVAAGGKLRMRASSANNNIKEIESTVGFADGAWHYATLAFGIAGAGTAAIYVDGKDFTPNMHDLSQMTVSNNAQPVRIADDGKALVFGGSLAELAFHAGKLVSLQEHQGQYVAFGVPIAPGTPSPGASLSYGRGSPMCTVVGDDAMLGDRVACYAGGGGLSDQVALARSPRTDKNGNPERLGLAVTPEGFNVARLTEAFEVMGGGGWSRTSAMVVADTAVSPRGDRTADTLTINEGGYVIQTVFEIKGNHTVTFSLWARGRADGDYTYIQVTDANRSEFGHCLVTLSKQWRRYSCTQTFTINPQVLNIAVDGLGIKTPVAPMKTVTLEAWGAQLEIAPAPGPYVPSMNINFSRVTRLPVTLSLQNAGGKFLGAGGGRMRLAFTTDPAGLDGTYFLDSAPQPAGRHYLRRDGMGNLAGEVHDKMGAIANDSLMTVKAVDWTLPHSLSLAWSAQAPLPGNVHTAISLDGMAAQGGRAAAYDPSAPVTIFLLSDAKGKGQPSGTVQTLTFWDAP